MSSTPAGTADEIAQHGWTAVPVDANAILNGKPYIHKPTPIAQKDIPFPSDPVVVKVQEYAKEHLIEQTYNHSMRVYHWGEHYLPYFSSLTYSACICQT